MRFYSSLLKAAITYQIPPPVEGLCLADIMGYLGTMGNLYNSLLI